jgi:hypothetical protein
MGALRARAGLGIEQLASYHEEGAGNAMTRQDI